MGIFASFFNKFMIHQSKDDENSCSHNEVVLDNLIINSNAAEITRTNIKLFCARAQDTAKIVNSTDDPAEFFDALNYMLDCLLYLMQYEEYGIFESPTPSKYYRKIISEIEETVDEFINRAITREKSVLSTIRGTEQKYQHYEKFLIALISAFDCAHTFWKGDKMSPHYTGELFTKKNYKKVQNLYDDLDNLYDQYVIPEIVVKRPSPEIIEHSAKLNYVEKERIMVRRVAQIDMAQFTSTKYDLDCPIYKSMEQHAHPYAFMKLNSRNTQTAKRDLIWLNKLIDSYRDRIPLLSKEFYIDVHRIAFHEQDKDYGYTIIVCEPYTFEGKVSAYPYHLQFVSKYDSRNYSATGKIYYGVEGKIEKADVSIWNRSSSYGTADGWIFCFSRINGLFVLQQAKTTLRTDDKGNPLAVYKDESLIRYEKERDADLRSFRWLETNLPSICPKSFGGFRRMKNSNSKNYQRLVEEARKMGKQI